MKKQVLEEYLGDIQLSKNQVETLGSIIRKEKRTWIYIIDSILLFVVLFTVIGIQIHGYYDRTEIVLDCESLVNEDYTFFNLSDLNSTKKTRGLSQNG